MAKKRKVGNLMALAVLSVMVDRPMHRYEIAATLRARGKDCDMDIKWGSLYTVVRNLAKAGFLEVVGSEREGARPERVIYRITEAGRAEMVDWTRELIAEPEPERGRFTAGLSILAALPPDEVIELFGRRLAALTEQITAVRAELEQLESSLPRLFLVETYYGLAMLEAEAAWTQSMRDELAAGTFPGQDQWRDWHSGGEPPQLGEHGEGGTAPERETKR
ncbi:PadR family transcriptional regulator [Nocardia donostiensis]|uniref:PadR family transcriptional regulator n=1 Tax=Nocardia donostiensis TaxID=1538463 RepID=A0A1W0B311_9NOCA|nr:PadR family transcriptional regulator [Nocardia donostiensis]ONM47352.1 PadR family transcriptional regulator [Nocardia donostiensis]OQS16923.1 PadR family transcriptional regulator [Nocardia donostiensis]OQS21131.1 PadR family transcriptional regulator [Nocardia donostiensis]